MASEKQKLYVGASRIRNAITRLKTSERIIFIRLIWPDLPDEIVRLIADHVDETVVCGSRLELPASWKLLTKATQEPAP